MSSRKFESLKKCAVVKWHTRRKIITTFYCCLRSMINTIFARLFDILEIKGV